MDKKYKSYLDLKNNNEDLVEMLLAHFKTHYPDKAQSIGNDDKITEWVKHRIAQARQYQLVTPVDVKKVINVAMIYGDEFDRLPWAKEILNRKASGSVRALLLEARSLQQLKKLSHAALRAARKDDAFIIRDFCQRHLDKVKTLQSEYKLNFPSDTAVKHWLASVAAEGLHQGFGSNTELELFLDLAMRHGKRFTSISWAQAILKQCPNPTDALKQLIKHSNKITARHLVSESLLDESDVLDFERLLIEIDEYFMKVDTELPEPPSPLLAGNSEYALDSQDPIVH